MPNAGANPVFSKYPVFALNIRQSEGEHKVRRRGEYKIRQRGESRIHQWGEYNIRPYIYLTWF